MTRYLFAILLMIALPSAAVEVSLGQGTFKVDAGLKGLMKVDVDLAVTTLSIRQASVPIKNSPVSFAARLDLFQSDTVNKVTDFASKPVTAGIPFFGGSVDDIVADFTPIPVPANYRVYGMDLDLGFSYAVLEHQKGYLRIGLNTGLTLPFMQTRDMLRDANVFLDILEMSDTEISTYKLGPAFYAAWDVSSAVRLNAEWILNKQWGRLNNDRFFSGVDIEGTYSSLDLNLRFQPKKWPSYLAWLKHGYLVGGYRLASWDYDKAVFSFPQATLTVPAELDMSFSKSSVYLGLGLAF